MSSYGRKNLNMYLASILHVTCKGPRASPNRITQNHMYMCMCCAEQSRARALDHSLSLSLSVFDGVQQPLVVRRA